MDDVTIYTMMLANEYGPLIDVETHVVMVNDFHHQIQNQHLVQLYLILVVDVIVHEYLKYDDVMDLNLFYLELLDLNHLGLQYFYDR